MLPDPIALFLETGASGLLSLYADTLQGDFLRYALVATGVYLVVNTALQARLAGRKIRPDTPGWRQIRDEILASLRPVMIFAAIGALIRLGAEAGIIPIYWRWDAYGYWWLPASFALIVIAHDAWFYWTHWLMHRPRLYRWFHRLHHKSHNPTPFTSYSFDWTEAALNAVFFPLALLVVPAHPIVLFAFTWHMMLRNALGHCGYEVFPARADGRPRFDWMTTVTHHDLHHANARWNLGLYFTWWDRWMGTENPDYHARFRAALGRSAPVAAALLLFIAPVAKADDIADLWLTANAEAVVEIAPCPTNPAYHCGAVIWARDGSWPRARPGALILENLAVSGAAWRGDFHHPDTGLTFSGEAYIAADRLTLTGCALILCDGTEWRRLSSFLTHMTKIAGLRRPSKID